MKKIATIIGILATLFISSHSFALSCAPQPSLSGRFEQASSVFVAKVVKPSADGLSATFTVEKFYKGNQNQQPDDKKLIKSPFDPWFNPSPFQSGELYLAFYNYKDGSLRMSACFQNIFSMQGKDGTRLDKMMELLKEYEQVASQKG